MPRERRGERAIEVGAGLVHEGGEGASGLVHRHAQNRRHSRVRLHEASLRVRSPDEARNRPLRRGCARQGRRSVAHRTRHLSDSPCQSVVCLQWRIRATDAILTRARYPFAPDS